MSLFLTPVLITPFTYLPETWSIYNPDVVASTPWYHTGLEHMCVLRRPPVRCCVSLIFVVLRSTVRIHLSKLGEFFREKV